MLFEKSVVLTQLRYTGMLETIKIRQMGYPVRYRFKVFADRYEKRQLVAQIVVFMAHLLAIILNYFMLRRTSQIFCVAWEASSRTFQCI